jgi:NAD(P)-dependent dehydrogenase (short-subunit alcohol dehydrogenase family)
VAWPQQPGDAGEVGVAEAGRAGLVDDPDVGILRDFDGEKGWQAFVDGIPLGRPQTAEDIGNACAYLASELAANITGEALNVSGGQQMH